MKSFINYFKRYKDIWVWTFIFTVICHGFLLLSGYVGIDTSEAIMTKGSNHYFVCLNMGRQSLVFLKWITGTLLINPYVVGILSLLFLWLSSIIWTYLFSYNSNIDSTKSVLLSSLVYISSVLFVETFYFKVQCTEFTIDFCLVGLSLLWTCYFINTKKIRYCLGAILLMFVYMGTYQALTIIYIVGAQMCFFLIFFYKKTKYNYKEMWISIFTFIGTFLVGFILNQLITKMFFSSGNVYYDDLMHWGNDSVSTCIYEIVKYIGRYVIGNSIYYPIIFTVLLILTFIFVCIVCLKNKKIGTPLFILDLLFLLISPAYLAIALGGNVVYRTQVIYPFLTLFVVFIVFNVIEQSDLKNGVRNCFGLIATIICVLMAYINMNNDLRLSYTDYMRNKEDSFIAMDLINRIECLQNEDSSIPVYFHGSYDRSLNPSCIYGESIGKSMFSQDTLAEPIGYYSSIRCIAYLAQFGKTYNIYNYPEEYGHLADIALEMEAYPKDDCVKLIDGIIFVNLSK